MLERVQELKNEAVAYMGAQNYQEAENVLKKALEIDHQDFELYTHLGNAQISQRKTKEGIQSFKTALMLKQDDAKTLYSIGCAFFLDNDFASAVKYLNQAERAGLQFENMYTVRSVIYAQSGDYNQAVREMSKAIKVKPLRADLYQRKIALQIQAKQMDGALATLQEFRELMSDALEGYELGVELYCMKKDYKAAEELLSQGKARFPKDLSFDYLLLKFYDATEQYKEAKRAGDYILSQGADGELLKETVILQAKICSKLQFTEESRRILEDYCKNAFDGQIAYLLMTLQFADQKYEKVMQTAETIEKSDAEIRYIAAAKFYYAQAVKHKEGIEKSKPLFTRLTKELRKVTIKTPSLYEAYIYRIISHTEIEEYDAALELTDFLDKAYPELADGQLFKYYIYKTMGKMDVAEDAKRQMLEKYPDIKVQW